MTEKILRLPLGGDKSPTARLLYGIDVREGLRLLEPESIHCVVTSPPYWNLRDYGEQEGQVGLEESPEEYVESLVSVFQEIRRVLRSDGTVWLNLGDSYAGSNRGGVRDAETATAAVASNLSQRYKEIYTKHPLPRGLKSKDLVGIPWRVAFALQADGWYLRQEIIWQKPNCMPESVNDRCTRSHEHVFLLTKCPKYHYDAESVMEDGNINPQAAEGYVADYITGERFSAGARQYGVAGKRNRRSVWSIPTQPYPGSHFAVMPPDLVEPCIKAGTSEHGCCPSCGAPWTRQVERGTKAPEPEHRHPTKRLTQGQPGNIGAGNMGFRASKLSGVEMSKWKAEHPDKTTGWEPSCACDGNDGSARPVVLDPFSGSATVGMVSLQLGRGYIGIDLNSGYLPLAEARVVGNRAPAPQESANGGILDLFGGLDD